MDALASLLLLLKLSLIVANKCDVNKNMCINNAADLLKPPHKETIAQFVSTRFTIHFLPHNLLLNVDIWVMVTLRFMLKARILSSSSLCSVAPFTFDVGGGELHPSYFYFIHGIKSTEPTSSTDL